MIGMRGRLRGRGGMREARHRENAIGEEKIFGLDEKWTFSGRFDKNM
jgi:hypothetical protein